MINYNIVLYIGLFLIVGNFILFILYEMNKRKLDIKLFKQKQLLRQSQQLGLEMALDLIDTRNKLKEKTKLIPMTEEEEYRNAGITKKEINENNN